MRTHPELGYQMLAGIRFLSKPRDIVICHQERFDGTGYPRGLRGEQIPLGARSFSAADTFAAMTSTRPYRSGLPYEVARKDLDWSVGSSFPASSRASSGSTGSLDRDPPGSAAASTTRK
jgi:HD-GYP domain-containing protein (c-di-GMP phosphodiesterase class II)